jgi:DNA-binding Lrp family transcriptional regulator
MSEMISLDRTDAAILRCLDDDPEATVVAISQTLGLARGTVQTRLTRLRESGALANFSRRLDPRTLGYSILAFVVIELSQGQYAQVLPRLRGMPEVLEAWATTGDGDIVARTVARDMEHHHAITMRMLATPGILHTRSTITMKELVPYRLGPLLSAHIAR